MFGVQVESLQLLDSVFVNFIFNYSRRTWIFLMKNIVLSCFPYSIYSLPKVKAIGVSCKLVLVLAVSGISVPYFRFLTSGDSARELR